MRTIENSDGKFNDFPQRHNEKSGELANRPQNNAKILLTTLWERTSARGTPYLSGFLGRARIVGFRGDSLPDGTETWNLFITPGREESGR